jgi:hypothetical protein
VPKPAASCLTAILKTITDAWGAVYITLPVVCRMLNTGTLAWAMML